MSGALDQLFRAMAQARDLDDLRGSVMDRIGESFLVRAWGEPIENTIAH